MKKKIIDPIYLIYDNGELHTSISKGNTKMGNIPQFNLLPSNEILLDKHGRPLTNIVGTCGNHCEACKKVCYAVRSARYHHNSIIPVWGRNTIIMRNDPEKLRKEINEYCRKTVVKYFRFHSSGALESIEQLNTYCQICDDNKDVTFYIYTKEFDILAEYILTYGNLPKNLVVSLSVWHDNLDEFMVQFKNDHMEKAFNIIRDAFNEMNRFIYDDHSEEYDLSKLTHRPDL